MSQKEKSNVQLCVSSLSPPPLHLSFALTATNRFSVITEQKGKGLDANKGSGREGLSVIKEQTRIKENERQGSNVRKARLLALHGWSQNEQDMKQTTKSLQKKLKEIAEIVFVRAPHALDQTLPIEGKLRNDARTWFYYHGREDPNNIKGFLDPELKQYEGWEESVHAVMTANGTIEPGDFDGIMGFSQGAVFTNLLLAYVQQQEISSRCKFAILISGFPASTEPAVSGLPIQLPSLHLMGEADDVVPVALQEALSLRFEGECRETFRHNKGHIIPQNGEAKEVMKKFIEHCLQ
jgi:predicted esterase